MRTNLLRKLAGARLPCTEADPATIDGLRVLEAAGHIKVLIPPPHVDCDDCLRQEPATVFEITALGWKALAADAPAEDAPPPDMSRSGVLGGGFDADDR